MELTYSVVIEGLVMAGPDDFEAVLDEAIDGLAMADAEEPAIGAVGADGSFEITVNVEASAPDAAVDKALRIVREALSDEGLDWLGARATRIEPPGT